MPHNHVTVLVQKINAKFEKLKKATLTSQT